jgi:hypothetical protein
MNQSHSKMSGNSSIGTLIAKEIYMLGTLFKETGV